MSLMSLPRFKHITVTWRVALESWKCLCGDLERAYLNYCDVLEALMCFYSMCRLLESKNFFLIVLSVVLFYPLIFFVFFKV